MPAPLRRGVLIGLAGSRCLQEPDHPRDQLTKLVVGEVLTKDRGDPLRIGKGELDDALTDPRPRPPHCGLSVHRTGPLVPDPPDRHDLELIDEIGGAVASRAALHSCVIPTAELVACPALPDRPLERSASWRHRPFASYLRKLRGGTPAARSRVLPGVGVGTRWRPAHGKSNDM